MLPRKFHQIIYVITTILIVITLPDSPFFLSVSLFILAGNWIAEGRFIEKLSRFKERKSLWILLSIYLVHVLWMFNSLDFKAGLVDLRLKLPLLMMPVIYGTIDPFPRHYYKMILQFFVAGVFINSLIISYILFGFSQQEILDLRDASPFISHIRFSLMVVISIFSLIYFIFFKQISINRIEKLLSFIALLWLISFLFFFQTLTGIVILITLLPISLIWWAKVRGKKSFLVTSLFLILLLFGGTAIFLLQTYKNFNHINEVDLTKLDEETVNGNPYIHHLDKKEYENGNLIWIYLAPDELEKEWNKVSEIPYYGGLDKKDQYLRFTLVRYMSSLGLRKDSLGFSRMSDEDIEMVEKGYTSHIYKKHSFITRIYEVLWSLQHYRETGDPSGQSIGQRLEYLKVGSDVAARFFWFGTGTGDMMHEFKSQYIINNSKLSDDLKRRAHNQYLTFLITFGIFGALWLIFAFIAPLFMERRQLNFMTVIALCTILLSMLNEDTLDTHIGVTFSAFIYIFFLYAAPNIESVPDEKTSD